MVAILLLNVMKVFRVAKYNLNKNIVFQLYTFIQYLCMHLLALVTLTFIHNIDYSPLYMTKGMENPGALF